MCICFYTLLHPRYSLVLATNRDEFLSRPTLPAEWRRTGSSSSSSTSSGTETGATVTSTSSLSNEGASSERSILCGLDVQGGGTWFGIEKTTGRFALLTNVREEVSVRTRSRGKLVTDWLESDAITTLDDHLENLRSTMDEYAGFNLLAGQVSDQGRINLGFVSNRSQHMHHTTTDGGLGTPKPECLHDLENANGPGVMSNGAIACSLDDGHAYDDLEKAWPKMTIGRGAFHRAVDSDAKTDTDLSPEKEKKFVDDLFEMLNLAYPDIKDREEVRSSVLVTPFDMFPPKEAWYATRAQTVLLVERGTGRCTFVERQAYEDKAGQPQWNGTRTSWTFNCGN